MPPVALAVWATANPFWLVPVCRQSASIFTYGVNDACFPSRLFGQRKMICAI
jgi:hypothetical protein